MPGYKLIVKNAKVILKTVTNAVLNISGIKDLLTGTGSVDSNNKINWTLQEYTNTAANFTALNPVLLLGQKGIETDGLLTSPKFKIGDGATSWNSLPYANSGGSSTTPTLQEVTDEGASTTNAIDAPQFSTDGAGVTITDAMVEVLDSTNASDLFKVDRTNDTVKSLGNFVQTVNFDKDKNNFRLSLTSGLSVTTSDVINAQTIYCTPHNGNVISLYDGTNWVLYEMNEISLALGTLTAGNYDVFCYANAGVPTLEFTAWTGSTTPIATTKLNGVKVKTSDNTRRLVGCFTSMGNQSATVTISNATPAVVTYTGHGLKNNAPVVFTSTGTLPSGLVAGNTYYLADLGTSTANTFNVSATPGGAVIATTTAGSGTHTCTVGTYTEDSNANRCLENFDNAVLRLMQRAEQTASWNYNGVIRQVNANLLNQINFINRDSQYVSAIGTIRTSCNNAAGIMLISLSLNNTTTQENGAATYVPQSTASDAEAIIANFNKLVTTGYNYLSLCEGSSTATTTWYGNTALYCQITGYKLS